MEVLQTTLEAVTLSTTAIPLLLASYIVYQRCFSPLASIPGPFFASLTPIWLAYAYWRQDWHQYAIKLHEKYGPIVRVAPDTVDVGDVAAVRVIYGTGTKFWKGRWYEDLGKGDKDATLLQTIDEPLHKQKRRLIDPIYTLKSVRESEHLFDEPITFFTQQMRDRNGQVVDIDEWGNVFAIDAFTAMTYGKSYGLLEHGRAPEMSDFVDSSWNPYTWLQMIHCGKFLRLYQQVRLKYKALRNGGKPPVPIFGWVAQQIEQELQEDQQAGEAVTLLQKSLRSHREQPERFSQTAVINHMFEIVFAGFETCGTTIPKIMYFIATTSGCQERLREELLHKGKGGNDRLNGLLKYDDLLQLPYLSACIHEGFRKCPMIGIALSRKVPKGGVAMNGFHLPEGTEIGITPWVTSYNKELMPEPEFYRPERWLEATQEQKSIMHGTDLYFGAGPASCPGKTLANALIFKTLAVVFSNFHVEAVTPMNEIKEINIFPVKWRNVKMKLTPLKK